ncbi:hypothetical protein Bca52824_049825 [Brassica carinata]|uniref:Uncharacterized protein n=1 Tax=Brassica carinata TaxID=52824 RepID=A0A8X7UUI3_BRACI|nr:hypothetical protein Bca52824_049825 [Brassica carinata]
MSRALLELLCQEVQVYHVVQRRLWNGTLLGHRTLTCRSYALGVHVEAYEEDKAEDTRPKKLQAEKTAEGIV